MSISEPTVKIASGSVRGRRDGEIAVFKGLPYAAAPFGPHRFLAPQAPDPWDGTREAAEFGPRPPQGGGSLGMGPSWTPAEGHDCLTVNVWTPDLGGSGLPVMVWLYGGAYMLGSSDQPDYDGARLASSGVVVVTLNYRVGMEGFAHVDGAPANRALLDQAAALRWVQANIAAFGGDPGNVTVFGESAGAGSVASLLAMPSARGLFRRAIAQSVPGTFFSAGLARELSDAMASAAGRRATLDDLVHAPPEDLLVAAGDFSTRMRDESGIVASTGIPFSPVVDGEVLPSTPWRALDEGVARDVELIVGFNRDEYRLFMAMGGQLGQITDADVTEIMNLLGPANAEKAYRAAFPSADADELYALVRSDWLFRMPSAHLATAHARAGGTAYAYELTWPSPAMDGELGACHGLDVPLTWGNLDVGIGLMVWGSPVPDEAEGLSEQIRRAWTSFAKSGDPGWPAHDPDGTDITHVFDVEPADAAGVEAASRGLWAGHRFDPLDR